MEIYIDIFMRIYKHTYITVVIIKKQVIKLRGSVGYITDFQLEEKKGGWKLSKHSTQVLN